MTERTDALLSVVERTNARDLLPYLAWAFSVDRWDEERPIKHKTSGGGRCLIWLKYKGTFATGALRRVVEPFGFLHPG